MVLNVQLNGKNFLYSPEMLVLLDLEPDQEKTWTRTYTFSDGTDRSRAWALGL